MFSPLITVLSVLYALGANKDIIIIICKLFPKIRVGVLQLYPMNTQNNADEFVSMNVFKE